MATYAATRRVGRTPEEVFDVIGTHCYENHPRWERKIVEVRRLTPGTDRPGQSTAGAPRPGVR